MISTMTTNTNFSMMQNAITPQHLLPQRRHQVNLSSNANVTTLQAIKGPHNSSRINLWMTKAPSYCDTSTHIPVLTSADFGNFFHKPTDPPFSETTPLFFSRGGHVIKKAANGLKTSSFRALLRSPNNKMTSFVAL